MQDPTERSKGPPKGAALAANNLRARVPEWYQLFFLAKEIDYASESNQAEHAAKSMPPIQGFSLEEPKYGSHHAFRHAMAARGPIDRRPLTMKGTASRATGPRVAQQCGQAESTAHDCWRWKEISQAPSVAEILEMTVVSKVRLPPPQ